MSSRIINEDSVKAMSFLPSNSIDLIFADPPYWMRVEGSLIRFEGTEFDGCDDEWDQFHSLEAYEAFTRSWLEECYRILKPTGSIWVIGGMQCIYTIGGMMQNLGFWLINDVIWQKKNPTPNFKGTRLNNSHETLIWATKTKNSKFTFHYKTAKELNVDTVNEEEYRKGVRKQMGSVWKFPVCSGSERLKDENGNKLHNTQKPLELLERILCISSNIEDTVLDPFAGTMTTAVAAKKLGRHYIMIEKEKKYCDYGSRRVEQTSFEASKLARAEFDRKPLRVSMQEMILAGYFRTGESFCFRDGLPVAKLCSDGKLNLKGEILDMHSCAALAKKVKAKRLNGFDYWHVIRNKKPVPISEIREDYRKSLQ